ncbi:MAG: hypothetical protein FWG02_01055 [Holophagaceae bacterium]|nr:hypothetical protein [Holophagaceae bacterium]
MTLRTPNPYRSYQTMLNLQRSKERLGILQEQITTDKRITRLSDDPTGASLVMDFKTSIERNKMFVKQGESAISFLKGTESALNLVVNQMDRVLELAEEGRSEVLGPRGREAMAAEVNGILTTILDLANTKEQGKFLFAGTKTQTQPYTMVNPWDDAGLIPPAPWMAGQPYPPFPWPIPDPNDGSTPFAAIYDGNMGAIDLDISPTATVTTNLTGEYVFQGTRDPITGFIDPNQDIFVAVSQLRDGMLLDDSAMIQQAFENIRAIYDRVNVCLATVGARHLQTENAGFNLGDINETLQSIQNVYEAPDYPLIITQFIAEQASQDATFSVISKMSRNSLFDYIG